MAANMKPNRSERRGLSPLTAGLGSTAQPAAKGLVLDTPQAAGAGCEQVTQSCGCIFCDIRLPTETRDGIVGHRADKDGREFVPCAVAPAVTPNKRWDR